MAPVPGSECAKTLLICIGGHSFLKRPINGIWTLCGTPAINIPVFTSESGLPMGIQLVGPRGDDARLLRTARWLAQSLQQEQINEEVA